MVRNWDYVMLPGKIITWRGFMRTLPVKGNAYPGKLFDHLVYQFDQRVVKSMRLNYC